MVQASFHTSSHSYSPIRCHVSSNDFSNKSCHAASRIKFRRLPNLSSWSKSAFPTNSPEFLDEYDIKPKFIRSRGSLQLIYSQKEIN